MQIIYSYKSKYLENGSSHGLTGSAQELKEKVDTPHETKPRPVAPQDGKTSVTTVGFPPHSNPSPPNVVAVKKLKTASNRSLARHHVFLQLVQDTFECTTVPPSHVQKLRDHTRHVASHKTSASRARADRAPAQGPRRRPLVAPPRNASRPAQTQALRVDKRVDNLPHIEPTVFLDGIRRTNPVHDRARPEQCVPHHRREKQTNMLRRFEPHMGHGLDEHEVLVVCHELCQHRSIVLQQQAHVRERRGPCFQDTFPDHLELLRA
ncbi:hypothetical protein PsorP6_000730 [Peronosclerospora sorghi]|uniref:Uncharacterized protein n=1 Tax=Peronosclerospora sorghi TaxID=230839 RepID=A0ACC0WTY0_9STRA|nr:hypothetical protein PsorP6_000730 [Peronosclerospora sorghi]